MKDWDPSFSYHATVSSNLYAESRSTSPSPSTSIAKTEMGLLWSVVMMRSVKDWDPSFSYHATVSSSPDADSASTSPSPSTSMAKTDQAASAASVMTCAANETAQESSAPATATAIAAAKARRHMVFSAAGLAGQPAHWK